MNQTGININSYKESHDYNFNLTIQTIKSSIFLDLIGNLAHIESLTKNLPLSQIQSKKIWPSSFSF